MKTQLKYWAIAAALVLSIAGSALLLSRAQAQNGLSSQGPTEGVGGQNGGGIDGARAVEIAREIAHGFGETTGVDFVRRVTAKQATSLSLSEILDDFDQEAELWEVRLTGQFSIHRGPMNVQAIRSDGLTVVLRASDGSIVAWGTSGNTQVDWRQ